MRDFARLPAGFRRLLRLRDTRASLGRDIDDEIAFHLSMREERLRRAGLSPADAQSAARARFGDVRRVADELHVIDREEHRARARAEWFRDVGEDVRYSFRTLRRTPAFAAAALLTLTLGIGANTAVFSVVNGVLLRPLPFPNAERVVMVWTQFGGLGFRRANISSAEMVDVATRTTAFEHVGAFRGVGGTLTGGCGTGTCEPQRIDVMAVTASVFSILQVPAARGRVFTADEDRRGHDGVIVLGDGFWHRHYGGDAAIVGRTITLDGLPRVVLGVMPPNFNFERADAYVPLSLAMDSLLVQRNWHNYLGIARLKPGVSEAQANAQLATLVRQLGDEFAERYPQKMGFGLSVQQLQEALVGDVRRSLLVLLGAVALVLAIACVNVANLSLARAEARHREIAVRAALGAGRGRIVRQILTESLVLSLAGAALGTLGARWAVRLLLAANPDAVPRASGVQVNLPVLLVTLAVAVITGIAFGLVPALQATRVDFQGALREEGRGSSASRSRQRARRTLIVAEVALATIVLSAAGLLMKSFWRLRQVDSGIRAENVVAMRVSLPRARYADSLAPGRFFREFTERVAAIPGVQIAAAANSVPTMGYANWDIDIEDRPRGPTEAAPSPIPQFVTPSYFAALGIPVRAGRLLESRDDGRDGLTAVVNEAMARRLWPNGAVGRRFRLATGPTSPKLPWLTIVGVVGDVRMSGPQREPEPQWIATTGVADVLGGVSRDMWIIARAADPSTGATPPDAVAIVPAARQALWAMDRNVNFGSVQRVSEMLGGAIAAPRFTMLLLVTFGIAALSLAAIGVYGVLAYVVAQRTRELGIRLALGAQRGDVLRLVVSQGLTLAGLGIVIGLAGAVATAQLLRDILFETPPRDPWTLAAIAILLVAVAVAASWLPARRATRVDPAVALREA